MLLLRTPKAHAELAPGQRSLGLRQRTVLLLAENTAADVLHALYNGAGATLVQQLLQDGYLQTPSNVPSTHTARSPHKVQDPAPAPTAHHNVAGVRMHLFDLCERLFAKRMPDTAEQLRQQLREARDVPSMQAVSELLLHAVHTHAGPERAQAIRQQLRGLWPDSVYPAQTAGAI